MIVAERANTVWPRNNGRKCTFFVDTRVTRRGFFMLPISCIYVVNRLQNVGQPWNQRIFLTYFYTSVIYLLVSTNSTDAVQYSASSEMPFLFECAYKRCDSSNYTENLDYGYYEKGNGNCTKCMEMCLNDEDCGSIECQDNSLLNLVKLNQQI